jgi:hypothetical protein
MKTQSSDTHPEIEKRLIEGYRRMTAREKLHQIGSMGRFAYTLALADVRKRHPDAEEQECRLRVASRWLDAGLMRKAFGWDPDVEGY